MSSTIANSRNPKLSAGFLVAATALAGVSGPADAAVTIGTGATSNIVCTGGVCTPTKKSAMLNVTQLESLLASGSVKVTTAGAKASDIVVAAAFSWASANALTLDAYHSVTVNKTAAVDGTGGLTLTTNDGGTDGALSFGTKGNVDFLSTTNTLTINGNSYTLVNNIATLASDIASNASGFYALANNYDASAAGIYSASPISTPFSGKFEGLGNTITKLTVQGGSGGMFAHVAMSGVVENLHLTSIKVHAVPGDDGGLVGLNEGVLFDDSVGGNITGIAQVGGLVGTNEGVVASSHSSLNLTLVDPRENDGSTAGGLVGLNTNAGSITASYATGKVKSSGHDSNGGLVGENQGTISDSYATGSVAGGNNSLVGGLVGLNTPFPESDSTGIIIDSYSTGAPSGGAGSIIGGLVGNDQTGQISDSYWDATTSGITNLSQGAGYPNNDSGITGKTTAQLQSGLPAGFSDSIWGESPGINGGLPYLLALRPA